MEEIQTTIADLVKATNSEYWVMHDKLRTSSYKSSFTQVSDMVKLGRMADLVKSLRDAGASASAVKKGGE